MNRPNKRTKRNAMLTRTTSYKELPPFMQREWWYEHTLDDAFKNDNPHRELTVLRPTNRGYPMNGYEYTLCTSIRHSKLAGLVAKDAGCQLPDLIPFNRLKGINKECLAVFM
jgi:hypothetical protein